MHIVTIKNGIAFPVHTLADGRKVAITSKHGYHFSDKTSCQEEMDIAAKTNSISFDYLNAIVVEREFAPAVLALPNKATSSKSKLTSESLPVLEALSEVVDIILVSFMVVDAMDKMGIRNQYPKVLAFNSTRETARVNSVAEKIVDLDNWAW